MWKPETMADADVDPVLLSVEWLLLFGAVVWLVMFLTGVMDGPDLVVHEALTAVAVLVFRLRRRSDA